jgi:hypothetical protein
MREVIENAKTRLVSKVARNPNGVVQPKIEDVSTRLTNKVVRRTKPKQTLACPISMGSLSRVLVFARAGLTNAALQNENGFVARTLNGEDVFRIVSSDESIFKGVLRAMQFERVDLKIDVMAERACVAQVDLMPAYTYVGKNKKVIGGQGQVFSLSEINGVPLFEFEIEVGIKCILTFYNGAVLKLSTNKNGVTLLHVKSRLVGRVIPIEEQHLLGAKTLGYELDMNESVPELYRFGAVMLVMLRKVLDS